MGLSALLADRQTSENKHRPSYVFMLLEILDRCQIELTLFQTTSLATRPLVARFG
jgi:hypothetical protein